MNKNELVKRLQVLEGMDNLSEDELKEMNEITGKLSALKAKDDAKAVLEAAQKDQEAETEKRIRDAAQEAVKKEREKWEAENRRPVYDDAPWVSKYSDERKFERIDPRDLSFALDLAGAFKRGGHDVQLSPAAYKSMSRRIAEFKGANNESGRQQEEYVKGEFEYATKGRIKATPESVEAAIKAATDPMYTGGSGIGLDWVGSLYSSDMWESVRANVSILSRIPQTVIPDGYSNSTIPLEGADFTVYKVAETTAANATTGIPNASVTASQIGTANKNITVSKLGARGMHSGELNEDSLIRVAPEMRRKAEVSLTERLESALIDGDTETSANKNINDIAGTPAATDYFLVWDGFRKLALVTNTGNSRSAGGSLTVEDYKNTLKLLGTAGLAGADPRAVAFIQDYNTMWAMMELPELKTRDTFNPAILEGGRVTSIYRVPVIDSFFMHMASAASGYERKVNTAGKVDLDTNSNNTTGAILAVRFDQWKFAYKRRMTIETTRFAESDSWQIVALMRAGLGYRDTEASAITYGVGV